MATQFVPAHLLGDLSFARHNEEKKLAEKAAKAAEPKTIAAAQMRQVQLANCGVPVQAAAALAREFEVLILRLATLEAKVDELSRASAPPHLKGVEKRSR